MGAGPGWGGGVVQAQSGLMGMPGVAVVVVVGGVSGVPPPWVLRGCIHDQSL